MRIAYFIMAHHKPELLVRMLNAIYEEDNIYLIHVDSSANDELLDLVSNLELSNSNIKLLPSRFLMWGGWSLVHVELEAIKYLLNIDSKWEYYINLSGQDFPLVTQPKIKEFLKASGGKNFITIDDSEIKRLRKGQSKYFIEDAGKMLALGDRKPFEEYFSPNIKPYHGSQWRIITREFADYSANSYLSYEMQDYYRYTLTPDEQFFQTLIMASPYKDMVDKRNMRCIRMETKNEETAHAAVLTMSDLGGLFNSAGLFARKFDDTVDDEVIKAIELLLNMS